MRGLQKLEYNYEVSNSLTTPAPKNGIRKVTNGKNNLLKQSTLAYDESPAYERDFFSGYYGYRKGANRQ